MTGLTRERAIELFVALDDADFGVSLSASTHPKILPETTYSVGIHARGLDSAKLKRIEEILAPFEVDFSFGLASTVDIVVHNRVPYKNLR